MRNHRIMKNEIRMITEDELKKVNPVLRKYFGARNQITSGSCEIYGCGKKRYNVSLEDVPSHKSQPLLKAIGKRVKYILDAEEVYHFGTKIA